MKPSLGFSLASLALGCSSDWRPPSRAPAPLQARGPATSTVPTATVPTPAPAAPTPAAAARAPALSASSDRAPPTAASGWEVRLKSFYASYAKGHAARESAYAALLAPELGRFIGQQGLTRAAALRAAERFFADKSDVAYELKTSPSLEPGPEGPRLRFEIEATWSIASDDAPDGAREMVANRFQVELEANRAEQVVSYVERLRKRHFKVGGDASEAARGFLHPTSRCDAGYDHGGVELARGSLVEDTGHFIELPMCGPGLQISRLIRYGGDELWVVETSYLLVPNPFGGSSLGGQDFLVRSD